GWRGAAILLPRSTRPGHGHCGRSTEYRQSSRSARESDMKHEGGSHDSLPAVAGRPVAAGAIRRGHALRHAAVSVCIVAGCLAGCASTPPPAGEIATARAALDSARREGAAQHAATALADA